jgi:hypothetical protein
MPIKDFMIATYKFSELGEATKAEIIDFCNSQADAYARRESRDGIIISNSLVMTDKLHDKFYKLFRCLINVGKPKRKNGKKCTLERVELLCPEKSDGNVAINEKAFELYNILGLDDIATTIISDTANTSDDVI